MMLPILKEQDLRLGLEILLGKILLGIERHSKKLVISIVLRAHSCIVIQDWGHCLGFSFLLFH